MKYLLSATALLAAIVVADKRDLCSEGSTDDNGNWYCKVVAAITYTGVGGSGSYNKVTAMNTNGGTCSSTPFGYSGSMSPLDEEVSMHFRGPLTLKQFAVYTPGAPSSSKKARRHAHERRHAHGRAHAHREHAEEKRGVGAEVTATIDGVVVSWVNEYSGAATSAAAVALSEPAAPSAAASSAAAGVNSAAPPAASGATGSSTGSWGRQAYYDSSAGTSQGLTFLNHFGGAGSGVFDYVFGNSLSYASSDGTGGASSPQTLKDTTLPSNAEIVIMSDQKCNNGDCGYTRPGSVVYHGFDGSQKAFFLEFGMPNDGSSSTSKYTSDNMPAVWMLNAQIPNTLQYGQADCSCWTSGCGEFDIFETLAPGDARCKSTLHGNVAGGDSDYFSRPVSGTIKAAVVLYNNNIHIKILDSSTDFASVMDSATISDICGSTLNQSNAVSLFALAAAA